jgi:hypothetical protein
VCIFLKNNKVYKIFLFIERYNMSMSALGMAEEFKGQVGFNCLWPRTAIATAAIKMLAGEYCILYNPLSHTV